MKRSFLLVEVLLAIILVAAVAAPLYVVQRTRHKKAQLLSEKCDALRRHDRVKLEVLESLVANPCQLKNLERVGSLQIGEAQLRLKKEGIRESKEKRVYLIDCKAAGLKSSICAAAPLEQKKRSREVQEVRKESLREEAHEDSTQPKDPQ